MVFLLVVAFTFLLLEIFSCIYALWLLFSSMMQYDLKLLLINIFRRFLFSYLSTSCTSRYTKSGRSSTFSQNAPANQKLYLTCSFQISLHLLLKKDISNFRHYLSFLYTFFDCIITILPPFFEFHCCCVMTCHWASWMVCNSLQFILFASYHFLVRREFHLLINFQVDLKSFSAFLNLFNWMISNSGTASRTSFFTPLPHWLQLAHFQSGTSSAANHLSKQFSKLATPISGTGTSIQLRTSFLIDWYLQLLHCRTDEAPFEIATKNSGASCCVLSKNCVNSTLTVYLTCTGYITFPSVLCTNFSNATTCSCKFLPS